MNEINKKKKKERQRMKERKKKIKTKNERKKENDDICSNGLKIITGDNIKICILLPLSRCKSPLRITPNTFFGFFFSLFVTHYATDRKNQCSVVDSKDQYQPTRDLISGSVFANYS